jgi:hypothetical protein
MGIVIITGSSLRYFPSKRAKEKGAATPAVANFPGIFDPFGIAAMKHGFIHPILLQLH